MIDDPGIHLPVRHEAVDLVSRDGDRGWRALRCGRRSRIKTRGRLGGGDGLIRRGAAWRDDGESNAEHEQAQDHRDDGASGHG